MSLFNFERHEFLEFFDEEKVFNEIEESISYTKKLKTNLIFKIDITGIGNLCSIILTQDNIITPIFDITIKNLSAIKLYKHGAKVSLLFFNTLQENFPYQDRNLQKPFLCLDLLPDIHFSFIINDGLANRRSN